MQLTEVAETWRPAPTEHEELIDHAVGAAVAGLWSLPAPGPEVPPLWHWFHFLRWPSHEQVGPDGHLAAGPSLPPIDDRRRMFAGGRWRQERPLRYDQPALRRQQVVDVQAKSGRSGELLFVTVRSEISQHGRPCVVEDQDLVYRSGPTSVDLRSTVPATRPPGCAPGEDPLALHTDAPLLFRMSALTANQHRIHYDRPYAVDVEHYAGLVVHGPLLVLHLAEPARRAGRALHGIDFRLRAPAFLGEPLAAVAAPAADGRQELRLASAREPAHATATLRS